jgi:hypothetical protein
MTILVIHNQNVLTSEITLALKSENYPFIETSGLRNGYDLLSKKTAEFHVIIVNYGLLSDDKKFLKKLAKNDRLRDIPLILALGEKEPQNIKSFKHTASYQWLLNPFTDHTLNLMILGAENEYSQRCALRREIHSRQSVFGAITRGTFRIKTFEQAEALTTMLSLSCPDPDRIAFGLFEMLANSIEHGNLEIGNEEKWRLMANNRHRDEINMRLVMPEYRDRYVEITFEREISLVSFKIEDQGSGFDFVDYLDIDFSANQTPHGRGIAMARATSFDYLEFMGNGNKLLAITKFAAE